ncbi:MAG: hypothetical protein CMI26_02145 [Opitutae bacterium]|nr:hypothetical protein [Opitutae bacterium]|tara:strand:- start:5093 stop:5596 length:504 start_codon:yes stop_codon:yes gene_type:complete
MPAPPPGQAIYVSKGEQDFGPFTFDELVEQMSKKQFEPSDLAWHQGISNWMALEQLPEWQTIQEKLKPVSKPGASPPPLEIKKAPPMAMGPALFQDTGDKSEAAMKKSDATSSAQVDPEAVPATVSDGGGSGILSKLLVSMAVVFFLAAVGFAGFILYKNWDKLGLQ